jgi:predicted acylesterase/phospholipase RssA
MRARQGLDSIEKIASKGQKKAANTISRGRVAGRVAGFLSGSSVASGAFNLGLSTGGVPGGIVGASIGALAGSSAARTANRRFRERAERKAERIRKQYDDLEAEMKKELKSSRPVTQLLLDASNQKEVEKFLKIVMDKEAALKPGDDPSDAWDEAAMEYDRRKKTR